MDVAQEAIATGLSPEHLIGAILPLLALAVGLIYFGLRLKMPPIVGFLLTGVILGPGGLKILPDTEMVKTLAELGVILLLFTIGLEFSIQSLLKLKRVVLLGGALQMLIGVAAVTPLTLIFVSVPWNTAVLIGILAALSSTAIVLKLFQDKGEMDAPHGRGALGVLIFQDLAVVPLFLIMPYLAGVPGGSPLYLVLAKVLGILVLVVVLANWVVPWVMLRVAQTRSNELFLFTVALICLGTAFLTEIAGLSLAMGGFLAGIIIAGSPYAYQAISSILPMRDLFTSFFFVSIGLLMDISYLLAHPFLTIGIALLVMIVNVLTCVMAMRFTGLSPRVSILIAFSLCQIGEFAFVLAVEGQKYNLLAGDYMKMFLNVAVLTMALTPVAISVSRSVSARFIDFQMPFFPQDAHVYENHAIVVGFGVAGQAVARASKLLKREYVVVDLNPASVQSFRKLGEPLFFGDAASEHLLEHLGIHKAAILVVTIPDPEATRRIISTARNLNKNLKIMARARFLLNIAPLQKLGATTVIAEEFEAAIKVFALLLDFYELPEERKKAQIALARAADPLKFRNLPDPIPEAPQGDPPRG
ncbi:MAG: cation:proton antiporter [Deltaproteobacteria bacterium]|nr:cation:proton antiporter [Deltaproteobacteria bacterium]